MKGQVLYVFLNLSQLLLGVIFQLLLASTAGISGMTDAYFGSVTILTTVSMTGSYFTEMFMQHYHALKAGDPKRALQFYRSVFDVCLCLGLTLLLVVYLFREPLIRLFAPGFSAEPFMATRSFLGIAMWSLLWGPVMRVNNLLLNAEMFFALPYVILGLQHLLNIISLILFFPTYGLASLAVGMVAGASVGVIAQQMYIAKRLGVPLAGRRWYPRVKDLVRTSFTLQLGHQIYGLKDFVTTNVLSRYPEGAISLFNYAFRVTGFLFSVANAARIQVFAARSSNEVAWGNVGWVRAAIPRVVWQNVATSALVVLVVLVVMQPLLPLVLGSRVTAIDVNRLYLLFVSALPYHLALAIELPFVQTTIAFKNGRIVLRIGIMFLALYLMLVTLLKDYFGLYAVPVALFLAQVSNVCGYVSFVRGRLAEA